jgi:sec-independent protein translocase protein TatB
MDSFFGIGLGELFFIAIIALVVLGPERLPGAIREVAKFMRMVRGLTNDLTSQFGEEMKVLDDLNPTKILQELTLDEPANKDAAKPSTAAAKPAATKTATKPTPAPAATTPRPAAAKTAKPAASPKPPAPVADAAAPKPDVPAADGSQENRILPAQADSTPAAPAADTPAASSATAQAEEASPAASHTNGAEPPSAEEPRVVEPSATRSTVSLNGVSAKAEGEL